MAILGVTAYAETLPCSQIEKNSQEKSCSLLWNPLRPNAAADFWSKWNYSEFLVEESSFDSAQSILYEPLNCGNEIFSCTNQQAYIHTQLQWRVTQFSIINSIFKQFMFKISDRRWTQFYWPQLESHLDHPRSYFRGKSSIHVAIAFISMQWPPLSTPQNANHKTTQI